jgi:hypothetical protein
MMLPRVFEKSQEEDAALCHPANMEQRQVQKVHSRRFLTMRKVDPPQLGGKAIAYIVSPRTSSSYVSLSRITRKVLPSTRTSAGRGREL